MISLATALFQDEFRLFESAAHDLCRVETHPVFNQSGVDTPEIGGGNEVTLFEISFSGRRVFAVLSALDAVANYEADAACAVICTTAVVLDTSTEFGEQEHDDVVGFAMGLEVVEEILYSS